MSQRNSFIAMKQVQSWSVDDVVTVLTKNGLESTCVAFQKREVDGEHLLNLTEGKLALWKRDLSLADIRKLSRFIHDLNTTPERFLLIDHGRQNGAFKPPPALPPLPPRPHSPASDEWDTDFEEDPTDDVYSDPPDDEHPKPILKPNAGFLHSSSLAQNRYTPSPTLDSVKPPIPTRPTAMPPGKPWSNSGNPSALFPKPPIPHLENLICNLNLGQSNEQDEYEEEEEYTSIEEGVGCNLQSLGFPPPPPRGAEPPLALPTRKITPAEQPPLQSIALSQRKLSPMEQPPLPSMGLPPRKLAPTEQPSLKSIRGASPTPYPKLSFGNSRTRSRAVSPHEETPHFNNIPAGIPNQMSALSNQGLKPPRPLPSEPEDYECIENPPEPASLDYYLQPLAPAPTLPVKPSRGVVAPPEIVTPSSRPPSPPRKKSFPDEVPYPDGQSNKLSDKLRSLMKMRQVSYSSTDEPVREKSPMPELQKPPPVERPGPGPRPLPPTPDAGRKDKMNPRRNSRGFTQMPWYHNVDRKRAEEMLKNGEDGKFLLRPSLQTQNPLTLTLWYNKRLYNISVRQRTDQRYALGTEKSNEQSFSSVEELVQHYQGEELVLYSGGERTGKTLLTSSPPRQSS